MRGGEDVVPEGLGAAKGFFVGRDDADSVAEEGRVRFCERLGAGVVDEDTSSGCGRGG